MERIYKPYLERYLAKKLVLVSGPRQCGKTTLAKQFVSNYEYVNFDSEEGRDIIRKQSWDRSKSLIIFDELHKKPKWKQWLKGIYDVEGTQPPIVVTGSAKLDTYRKVGDSLAGRYFQYRLHPFDVREIHRIGTDAAVNDTIERLLVTGGFPEPFLEGSSNFYGLWKKSHLDIILKQDLLDLESVREIKQLELLIDLLRTKVGSPISYNSLSEDLQVSDKTVKRWLELLENMYVIFKVLPYSKKIARAVLKQPKYYFFDIPRAEGEGSRLENLVAASLLKEVQFRQDCLGEEWGLHYLAKKGSGEVDFLITENQKPKIMIEVKASDEEPSKAFRIFASELGHLPKIQLVHRLKREKSYPDNTQVRSLGQWLISW